MPAKHLEKDLYLIVEQWMRKRFKCFNTKINKGIEYGRIDVLGISDIGGDFTGDVETIAIEVKRGSTPFTNAAGQAVGYRVYADRVYLADTPKKQFSRDQLAIASNLGIGLIQIVGTKCEEILASPLHQPIPNLQLRLFEDALDLGKCQLCHSVFDLGDNFKRSTNSGIKAAITKKRALVYPLEEVESRKVAAGVGHPGQLIRSRRYICRDCIGEIFDPLTK